MRGSDVAIVTFRNGQGQVVDSFAEEYAAPIADSQQDWVISEASQSDTATVVTVERPLITSDASDH